MKKTLLLTLCSLFVISASAQKGTGKFNLGVKAGMNVSSIMHADIQGVDSDFKPGIYLGLFGEINLVGEKLKLQPELVYSRQGNYYDNGPEEVWLRLNYLNIPVILKTKLFKGLYLETGVQLGILCNAREKIDYYGEETHSLTSMAESTDFSIALGVSYKLRRWDFTMRWNIGLTDTFKSEFNQVFDDSGTKGNLVAQFGAGFRF